MKPIFIKTNKKFNSFEDLIIYGFNITEDSKFCKTYNDIECKFLQCDEAYRSFDDLYFICKTYFPKTRKDELAKFLLKDAKIVPKYDTIQPLFCLDIKYLVFRKHTPKVMSWVRYGNKYFNEKGNGKYSFNILKRL